MRGSRAFKAALPILTILFSVSACSDGGPTGPGPEIGGLPRALSMEETLLVEAGNDFAFRFLQKVHGETPDSNLFLAPLSASMALGMTLNGAAGNTFDEMRETLGFGTMSLESINRGYRDLIDLLVSLDPRVEIGVANSIWYRQGYPVRADFLTRVEEAFSAVVRAMDFGDPGAAGVVNGWVSDETRGKIKEIVESPIDPNVVMFLINATYFKGKWTHRFDKGKTASATFFPEGGGEAAVQLMEIADTLRYAETETYQVVDLPYGGRAFSMTVVLPKAGTSVHDLVATLEPGSWATLVGGLREMEGTVYLPRFRMEWEKALNETLQKMGMVDAFIPGTADFSGLSEIAHQVGLYVSKVKQKSYVDVNEEGTEAAGVTVVEIKEVSAPERFHFRADRPFLFLLRERFSETILFAGVFMTPP